MLAMKFRNFLGALLLGTASCTGRESRHQDLALPADFSIKGRISIDERMYGGALGGYRYDVVLVSEGVTTLLLSEQSNRTITVQFPDRKTIVLSFCKENRVERVQLLKPVRNLRVYRAC
jgi:hypothetical protein